jgi:ribosomal protein L14E/L6E/L27E
MQAINLHEIVLSLAGHDRGRIYLVIGEEEGRLLLVDGRGRKLDAPKRKSPKHLRGVGTSAHPAVERLHRGQPVTDKQIRCALAAFRETEFTQSEL